jgi:septal ring factor EnvC (AmiA/AmiB activator)
MRCASALAFSCFLSVSLWAGPQSPSLIDSFPVAPESSWQQLDQLLTELSTEAASLADDSAALKASLRQASDQLTMLSQALVGSQTAVSELSASLRLSESSLQAFAELQRKEALTRDLELWCWRGAAGAFAVFTVLALLL